MDQEAEVLGLLKPTTRGESSPEPMAKPSEKIVVLKKKKQEKGRELAETEDTRGHRVSEKKKQDAPSS